MDKFIQIDVKKVENGYVHCNLQTGDRDVRMFITEADYQDLIQDGFFKRDGKSKDSAGILNTTVTYYPERHKPGSWQTDEHAVDPDFAPTGIESAYPY